MEGGSRMGSYDYIIIGGGMTADSAARGIREIDGTGRIAVFSAENDPPYNRPPLSKGLWKGDPIDSIWRKITEAQVDFFPGTSVASIDRTARTVETTSGGKHNYERLLLATGGKPKRLPFGGDDVIYFRTVGDYRKLKSYSDEGKDFIVIGGGFIGSEVAAALAMNDRRVTMVFPEDGIGARIFPKGLSRFLASYYSEKGIRIVAQESITAIKAGPGGMRVSTKSGREIGAGSIVAGLGIVAEDSLAKSAGLLTDNGIIVNEFLSTSDPNIYAAGDAANFFSQALGLRQRVEHEDNANTMGSVAGHNMAGKQEAYDHLPFFYSDMFDLGYEAVGELNPDMEIVEDWEDEFRKGVVYYLRDGIVRGVLLWNTWGMVDSARGLIRSGKLQSQTSLKGIIRS
jgi:3-phenylpropionate/trans-cinnamate dioxygenase ferredoxin reductase component